MTEQKEFEDDNDDSQEGDDEMPPLSEAIKGEQQRMNELPKNGITPQLVYRELIDTVMELMSELAESHESLEEEVLNTAPAQSVLLPADGRLIVGTLARVYAWAKIVKNERAQNQDRVPEALEIVTELRVAYERALELLIDGAEQQAQEPLDAARTDPGPTDAPENPTE